MRFENKYFTPSEYCKVTDAMTFNECKTFYRMLESIVSIKYNLIDFGLSRVSTRRISRKVITNLSYTCTFHDNSR